ncbi:MAG: hypothetical protein JNM52_09685 [Betaproteobacteria bacterium]|nr:hypothetical protein [Betaproteobacteria bacterium]
MAQLHQLHELKVETISKRSIFIIGTDHKYQRGSTTDNNSKFCRSNEANEFQELLIAALEKHSINGIAEEAFLEQIKRDRRDKTLPNQLALAFATPHRYCDPNFKQRNKLGICDTGYIKICAAIKRTYADDDEKEQINKKEALELHQNFEKREKYWISQLIEFDRWPVLFICGALHVESFKKLASQDGFEVTVLESDWSPSDRTQSSQG